MPDRSFGLFTPVEAVYAACTAFFGELFAIYRITLFSTYVHAILLLLLFLIYILVRNTYKDIASRSFHNDFQGKP